MTLLLQLVCVLCVCSSEDVRHVYAPGDIIIGGLFPIHLQTNRSNPGSAVCTNYNRKIFLRSQVMIYAINEINQDPTKALPNITLGYDLYDTCGDVWFATRAALHLLKGQSEPQSYCLPADIDSALPEPQTKVVIGEMYSEVSIAVARILSLSSVTQISYGSTSELLSRKSKFPTFLRTVPSDTSQTKAIAELVRQFDWRSVAIVGSDDEYGKYGSDCLVENINKIMNVCIDFVDILPGNFALNNSETRTKLFELMKKIEKSPAEAIILFTKGANVNFIMEGAIQSSFNRTWIASDSWSTSTSIASMPDIQRVGQVFGFIPNQKEIPGFRDYVINEMFNTTNKFIQHYLLNEQQGSETCLDPSCLVNYIDRAGSYYTYLAVNVVVEVLRHLLKCDSQKCERGNNFNASEFLTEIHSINVTVNSTRIWFDANGDPSIGYDILQWNLAGPKHSKTNIGVYWPSGRMELSGDLIRKMRNSNVTAFNCFKMCEPGYELKQLKRRCCVECAPCQKGESSSGRDAACQRCGDDQYSSLQRDKCLNKTIEFLDWRDPFVVILTFFDSLGIIATVLFAVLFTIHRRTPIIKAVGGYLCFLELLSLLACFCLVFTFTGRPTEASCFIGLPVFCLAFTLCISCILANLFQIMLGFNFDLSNGRWLQKLNCPVAVVAVIFGLQLTLFIPWLALYRPHLKHTPELNTTLLHCAKGSKVLFGAMLAYNAVLAFVCFLFAFKGKRLPDLYKNASLITLSMVLFLVLWIPLIPIYMFKITKYTRKIEAAAIVISSYSILCCHLAPKCYIMLFKKEINNENAITEHIRKHYERKEMAVVTS
ncbi:G-protein coupled receptor family C group 6 member A-like [Genypterus blacodes]|uniref:G-protein coupled receptor family C group 6 member A-like n=1 Tax=Genypterus blacodes TaxID=154954 RepID=UPI003F765E6A